jgi:hypothetical protein
MSPEALGSPPAPVAAGGRLAALLPDAFRTREYGPIIRNGRARVLALPPAPASIEPDLQAGVWLVLCLPAFGADDRGVVSRAVEAVEAFGGRAGLATRRFEKHEEIRAWCPAARTARGRSVWLLLQDGELAAERAGHLSAGTIAAAVRAVLEDG